MTRYSIATAQGARMRQEDRALALPDMGLFAVADGMGGHEDGDKAAQAAVIALSQMDVVAEAAQSHLQRPPTPPEMLGFAIRWADLCVRSLARPCSVTGTDTHKMSCGCKPPGSTLTMLWLQGGSVWLGHVGDSRCYRLGNDGLRQMTKDHGNLFGVFRFLGNRHGAAKPDIAEMPSGRYLLCTDGLVLSEDDEAETILRGPVKNAAQRLVDVVLAKKYSHQDNVTAIVVDT